MTVVPPTQPQMPVVQMCLGALSYNVHSGLKRADVYGQIHRWATLQEIIDSCQIHDPHLLVHCLENQISMGAIAGMRGSYQLVDSPMPEMKMTLANAALTVAYQFHQHAIYQRLAEGQAVTINELEQDFGSMSQFAPAMKYHISQGIFELNGDKISFASQDTGKFLTDGVPSLIGLITYFNNVRRPVWEKIGEYLIGTEKIQPWPFEGEEWDIFSRAVSEVTFATARQLPKQLDLSGVPLVVDIGSGKGGFCRWLKQQYPETKFILADVPEVLAGVEDFETFPCNVLEDRLPAAPVYLIANFAHVLGDDELDNLLSDLHNCKVVLVDFELSPDNLFAGLISPEFVLTAATGGNRTQAGYGKSLRGAGFQIDSVEQVEGTPATLFVASKA